MTRHHHHYVLAALLGMLLLIAWTSVDAFSFCFSMGSRSNQSAGPPWAWRAPPPMAWRAPAQHYTGAWHPGESGTYACPIEQIIPSGPGLPARCARPD